MAEKIARIQTSDGRIVRIQIEVPETIAERSRNVLEEFAPFPVSPKELEKPFFSGRRQDISTIPLRPLTAIEKYGGRIKEAGIEPVQRGIERGIERATDLPENLPLPIRLGAKAVGETFLKPTARIAANVLTPFTPSEFGTLGAAAMGVISPRTISREFGEVGGRIGEKLRVPIRKAGEKTTSQITNIPEETFIAFEKNPKLLESKTIEQIASSRIPEIADKFENIKSGLHSKARKILSTSKYLDEGAVSKSDLMASVRNVRKELGGIFTDEAASAAKVLKKVRINFNKLKNTVSQSNVKDLIEKLDKEISWDKLWKAPETLTTTDKSLIGLRTRMDAMLKKSNKEYADLMKPLAEAIQTRNEFFKKFGVERIRDIGEKGTKTKFVPSTKTFDTLKRAETEGKLTEQRLLEGVEKVTGERLSPEIQNAILRRQIETAELKVPFTGLKMNVSAKGIAEKSAKFLRNLRTPFE